MFSGIVEEYATLVAPLLYYIGFSGTQWLRICLPMQVTWVPSLSWEDSPGGGNGSPLQYSCLENPMDRGAW